MRKLLVTCQCGQQMQVPRSAIGKMGMCPTCGRSTRISNSNTRPLPNYGKGPAVHEPNRRPTWQQGYTEPPEDAKQRFGQAVDHYYAGRYAESLAIFDSLAHEFPDNPDIEHGRAQCLKAMKRPVLAPPSEGGTSPRVVQGELDMDTIRRVVLEKLLNGSSDEVQLRAAEIACKYLNVDAAGDGKAVEQEMAEAADTVVDPDNGHADHMPSGDEEQASDMYSPKEASNG